VSINNDPVHTYLNDGVFNVVLTAYNECGEDSFNTELSIYLMPSAEFLYEINELEIQFQNFSQNADSYAWEFGDGITSEEENPLSFFKASSYSVNPIDITI